MTTHQHSKRPSQVRSVARRAKLAPDTTHFPDGLAFVDDHCANCLEPMPDDKNGLFCSDWCQETTKHVRYFRRVFRDGRIEDPDVQHAVRTRLAFLPRGGYVALQRNLSPQTRAAVKERAQGECQACGEPGSDIDHVHGSSPELDNLQLLCQPCHLEKTTKNFVPASAEVKALITQLLGDRVLTATPQLLADDNSWDSQWRGLKKARRQRLTNESTDP